MKTVQRVRLKDINTPETNRKAEREAGLKSKKFVEDFVFDWQYIDDESGNMSLIAQPLLITTHKTGKFGRWIAEVVRESDGKILTEELLTNKLAEKVNYD